MWAHIYIYVDMRMFYVASPLGASWALLGLPQIVFWGSKTLIWGRYFLMIFHIHFGWVCGANLGPTWPPKSTKIDEKCFRMLTCFLIDF